MNILTGMLIGILCLAIIRLYHSHDQFARAINRLFAAIERAYPRIRAEYPKGLKGFFVTVILMSLFISLIASYGDDYFWQAFIVILILIVLGAPLLYEISHEQQQSRGESSKYTAIKFSVRWLV